MTGRAAAIAVALLLAAAPARAWEPFDPSRPVWAGRVGAGLSSPGSTDLGGEASREILATGLETWSVVACTGLETTAPSIVATPAATGDGASTVAWVESDWPFDPVAIGVTVPQAIAGPEARILEADMFLNGADYVFADDPTAVAPRVDARSVVLHELGHFLGLGHSASSDALMNAIYRGGRVPLSSDDVAGICALYPDGASDCAIVPCAESEECVDGTCVPRVPTGAICSACRDDTDCPAGLCVRYPDASYRCAPRCAADADCGVDHCEAIAGAGALCVRIRSGTYECDAAPCASDRDCGAGASCHVGAGECVRAPPPDTDASARDASSSPLDAGAEADADPPACSGPPCDPAPASAACGCRVAGSATSSRAIAAGLAILLLVARRRDQGRRAK